MPPPEILASKKRKEDLEELCYFIHIILNPNDPLLITFIDYRLISTYWEIVSMSLHLLVKYVIVEQKWDKNLSLRLSNR